MKEEKGDDDMITKDEIMQILDLENADFDTLQGITDLQHRLESAIRILTEDKFRETTDRLSSDPTFDVLAELDSILDEKKRILKNQSLQLKNEEWNDIENINREWLIPNWLPANSVTMLTGHGGTGKSWLILQVACEIASGAGAWYSLASYDDSSFTEQKHIIFATYEDEPSEIKRRLNALSSAFGWIKENIKTIKKHIHIIDMRGIGSIWGPGLGQHIAITGELLQAGEQLRKLCEDKSARLLILDPLSGAFGGNENDRSAVYDFISSFRGWGDQARCAMLLIGHLPKTQGAAFSGSTAWEASVRSMWQLGTKDEDNQTYYALQHTKSNYARLQTDIPLKKNVLGWWKQCDDLNEACNAYEDYKKGREITDEGNEYNDVGF